jgi:SSS family transporter
MSPYLILGFIAIYFLILISISYFTGKNADNDSFFIGNRKSHWFLIALGLIGDSLSGVTFISVPGKVVYDQFSYLQLVFGYLVGYWVISYILLPVYYKLKLTSIYSYLLGRFGVFSQKTGSFFFILSRLLGAGGRLFLAVMTIQIFVFDRLGINFYLTVAIMIILMIAYTYRGGIKTLVWTDSFQSILLLGGLIFSIIAICSQMHVGVADVVDKISDSDYSKIFFWEFKERNFFWKQFLGGMFIAISMTGLDQNMMQKNLSCPNLKDAQKNIMSFSFVMVLVNVLFISLGALLFIYARELHIVLQLPPPVDPATITEPLGRAMKLDTDRVFPTLALDHLGTVAGLAFIVGLTAATFSSADSVLTTLATSFCIDFLNFEKEGKYTEKQKTHLRKIVHLSSAILLFLVIVVFKVANSLAIIDTILYLAGLTYGPLLGLFAFGLFTRIRIKDAMVPVICLISPVFCYFLNLNSAAWFGGYKIGPELILINGLITFILLLASSLSKPTPAIQPLST